MRKKALALLLSAVLVLTFLPSSALALYPDEGNIPITDIYAIDSSGQETENPTELKEGQIWVNKNVEDNEDGTFGITLYVWGAEYDDDDDGVTSPLDLVSPSITITDVIGAMFKYNEDADYDVGVFDVDGDGVATWIVSQDAILDGIKSLTFTVTLKEGWVVDTPYYTNKGASASFQPREGNPYYYETERIEKDAFELSNINWNNGQQSGVNTLDIKDNIVGKTLSIRNTNDIVVAAYDGVTHNFKFQDYNTGYSNENGVWVEPTGAADFTWGSCWDKGGGDGKTYYVWIKGLEGSGTITRYTIIVNNNGGNTGGVGDRTTYWETKYNKIDGFEWDGNDVKSDLPNSGMVQIVYIPPQLGSLTVTVNATEEYDGVTYAPVWQKEFAPVWQREFAPVWQREYQPYVIPTFEKDVTSIGGTLVTWRNNKTFPGGTFGNGMTYLEVDIEAASKPEGITYRIADSSPSNKPIDYYYNVRIEGNDLVFTPMDNRFIRAAVTVKLYTSAPSKSDPSGHTNLTAGEELRVPLPVPAVPKGKDKNNAGPIASATKNGNDINVSITYNGNVVKTLQGTYAKNGKETLSADGYVVNLEYSGNSVKSASLTSYPSDLMDLGGSSTNLKTVYMFVHFDGIKYFTTGEYEFAGWRHHSTELVADYNTGDFLKARDYNTGDFLKVGDYNTGTFREIGRENKTRIFTGDFDLRITGPGDYEYNGTISGSLPFNAIDLEPGMYTVTISGNGITPITENVNVPAGGSVQKDFVVTVAGADDPTYLGDDAKVYDVDLKLGDDAKVYNEDIELGDDAKVYNDDITRTPSLPLCEDCNETDVDHEHAIKLN